MADLDRASGWFFTIGLVALVVACLTAVAEYAVPIAIAVFLWVLINAFANALRRLPRLGPAMPDWLARIVAVLAMFAIVSLSLRLVAGNVGELGQNVDGESVLLRHLQALGTSLGLRTGLSPEDLIERLEVESVIAWGLRTAQQLLTGVSLVFLYVLFLLVDQRFYDAKLRALFPDAERRDEVETTIARIGGEVTLYLWLMTLLSAGVGLVTGFFCWAVGLDGPIFWAFLAFALNFVPTIGSITAVVLPAFYALLTLDDPFRLFMLVGGLAATQFVAGELVLPRLMGDRLNLSSFVILLTLVVWGAMWGPAGMFMAIPITVILIIICARFEATRPIAIILSKDGKVPPSREQRRLNEQAVAAKAAVDIHPGPGAKRRERDGT